MELKTGPTEDLYTDPPTYHQQPSVFTYVKKWSVFSKEIKPTLSGAPELLVWVLLS